MTAETTAAPVARVGTRREPLIAAAYYLVLGLTLAGILTQTLADVLPAELARRIGFNSEGILLAIVLGVWIQAVLPRLAGRRLWLVSLLAGAVSLAVASGLYTSDLPSRFKTLNETFFALAALLPYLALARPLARRWPLLLSGGLLALVVLGVAYGPADSPMILLAEAFAVLILAPLAFDVVDRGILDPRAVTRTGLRYAWYAGLILVPLVVVLLGTAAREGGGGHAVLEYIGRCHEGVIGVLLTQLFFAVGLRRTGRPARDGGAAR